MLAKLLLFQAFVSSALANPLVWLPSLNGRKSVTTLNETADIQLPALSNASSQVADLLAQNLYSQDLGCFPNAAPQGTGLKETKYLDCINAAWRITVSEMHPKADRYFSRLPGRSDHDFLVPDGFIQDSCAIIVDVISETDYDIFSLVELQKVALELVESCVKPRPHLGGRDRVGPKQVTQVLIFGRSKSRL